MPKRGKKKRFQDFPDSSLHKTKPNAETCMCLYIYVLHKYMYWNSCFPASAVSQLIYGAGLILTFLRLIFSMDPSVEAHLVAECSGTYRL